MHTTQALNLGGVVFCDTMVSRYGNIDKANKPKLIGLGLGGDLGWFVLTNTDRGR
jgi:hypothetical protein